MSNPFPEKNKQKTQIFHKSLKSPERMKVFTGSERIGKFHERAGKEKKKENAGSFSDRGTNMGEISKVPETGKAFSLFPVSFFLFSAGRRFLSSSLPIHPFFPRGIPVFLGKKHGRTFGSERGLLQLRDRLRSPFHMQKSRFGKPF